MVWKPAAPADQDRIAPPPLAGLRFGAVLAAATAFCAIAAAGMESWRFALLLRGRTEVLLASQVSLNDSLVIGFGIATVALALICAVVAVPAVLRAGEYAAAMTGRRQTGSAAGRVLRFVVPGWNLYGAGEMLAQTDGLLRLNFELTQGAGAGNPKAATRLIPSRLSIWWWVAWAINGALMIAVALRGVLSASLQAAADSVELHIALDISAAAVALLTGLVLRRFVALIKQPSETSLAGWVLLPPRSGRPAAVVDSAVADPVVPQSGDSESGDSQSGDSESGGSESGDSESADPTEDQVRPAENSDERPDRVDAELR